MDAISPVFRVATPNELPSITLKEWWLWQFSPADQLLYHRPTKLCFAVEYDAARFELQKLLAPDITLRLIHTCHDASPPSLPQLTQIARRGMQVVLLEQPHPPFTDGEIPF